MATRPTLLPRWAETAGGTPDSNIAEPTSALKDAGWQDETMPPSGVFNWLLWLSYKWLAYLDSNSGAAVFGFGTDGALNFDGVSTVAGLVPSGSVYTMNRHLFPTDMTVANGVTVVAYGFGIWGTGTLTLTGTAKIDASGGDASSRIGAAAGTSGIWAGGAGSNGGTAATNGSNATLSNMLGGAGGVGGTSDDAHTGGTVSGETAPAAASGNIRQPESFRTGMLFGAAGALAPAGGGGGSGGGGGGGGTQGGGGGAGGSVLPILFRTINLSASCSVQAKGGAGANGQTGGGFAAGGGGGGGGGAVLLGYRASTGTAPAGRVSVAGGAGGTGNATGATGSSGLALIEEI